MRGRSHERARYRPTWAEVDLGALARNLERLRRAAPRSLLLFVVKGDGYGHGAVAVSREAERLRLADWLGVSSVEEGVALRRAGVRLPILILGSLYPFESALAASRHALTPTVASLEGAARIEALLRRRGARLDCHVKIDTGMGRIGVRPAAAAAFLPFFARARALRLGGVYTHMAAADSDLAATRAQLRRFAEALKALRPGPGVLRHAANSAAALRCPESRLDMIRPGLAAYGLCGEGFEPVLSIKSRIVFLKNLPARARVGYGGHFRAPRAARIATLPIGYADGLHRLLSVPRPGLGPAYALVEGRPCPLAGRMSMDMLTLDVTKAPSARVGSEAVLLGRSGRRSLKAGELASWARTIPYEIATSLSARVPRRIVFS